MVKGGGCVKVRARQREGCIRTVFVKDLERGCAQSRSLSKDAREYSHSDPKTRIRRRRTTVHGKQKEINEAEKASNYLSLSNRAPLERCPSACQTADLLLYDSFSRPTRHCSCSPASTLCSILSLDPASSPLFLPLPKLPATPPLQARASHPTSYSSAETGASGHFSL